MKWNKTLRRAAALALTALLLPGTAVPTLASGGDTAFDGGTILISSAGDLAELAVRCSLDTWSQDKTVVLTRDISLVGAELTAIPSFDGTFDGGGHTISGLSIQDGTYPAGLFGIVQQGAVIRDLTVTGDVSPSGDADTLGGIAGINHGKLTNCAFRGFVSGTNTVGGVVGLNEGTGQLINCSFRGAVTGEHYVGGIAGQNVGSLIQCVNDGSVNTTEVDPETDLPDLEHLRSTENLPAGTDIGGIAGFSTGLLQSCRNNGSVGYEHMGYNVGGIVGRQSGYLDGCVNSGTVRGRKDVGGIAGQMEPQVTLKYDRTVLSDLWDELDVLEELMDRALSDAEDSSDRITSRMDSLSDSIGTAKDTAVDLTDAMTDWANGNIDQVNDASARVSWVLDRMEPVTGDLEEAMEQLEDAVGAFSDALEDADAAGKLGKDAVRELRLALEDLKAASVQGSEACAHVKAALEHLRAGLGDPEQTRAALEELAGAVSGLSDAFSAMAAAGLEESLNDPALVQLQEGAAALQASFSKVSAALEQIRDALEQLQNSPDQSELQAAWAELRDAAAALKRAAASLDQAVEHLKTVPELLESAGNRASGALKQITGASASMEEAVSLLQQAGEDAADIIEELAEMPSIRFTPVGSDLTGRGDALDDALSQVLDQVNGLNDAMSASSDILLADLRAINRQVGVITDLLRQAGEDAGEDRAEDHFEDISQQELAESRTSGRISNTRNLGSVEGDVNTAGIVGSMAIEYDFDPEDDLTEDGDRSPDFRYQAVAVVWDSVNEGAVTGKKDYAGGIVGRMDLGAVYLCQAYGSVESTDGDYVGGIAGLTRSAIRRCFAKCTLSGNRYVGGITGSGDEDSVVENCRTLVRITDFEQYAGAISGTEDGEFTGNCFVSHRLAGLGRVSYGGKAEPVSYETLSAMPELPDPFRSFTLTFTVEGAVLKTMSFNFGDSFGKEVCPAIPEKEGHYARWDPQDLTDLCFDTVVEAVYTPYITALSSEAVRENGRPVFYAEGDFRDGDTVEALAAEEGDFAGPESRLFRKHTWTEQWHVRLPDAGVHTLRYLPPDEHAHLQVYIRQDGAWEQVQGTQTGRYLAFEAEEADVEIAVFTLTVSRWLWVLPALLAAALCCAVLRRLRSSRKKRKSAARTGPLPKCAQPIQEGNRK